QACGEGVQVERAVRVADALGGAGGAGGVAERGQVVLVPRYGFFQRRGGRDQFVVVRAVPVGGDHRHLGAAGADAVQQRQQRRVDEHHAVIGVVDDVGDLVGCQPQVERVQHGSRQRSCQV